MRVLLVNHHTPYLRLLATALPDSDFFILPSKGHAPTGWRDDQRPRPPNTCIVDVPVPVDVFIMQTDSDWDVLGWTNYKGVVALSHNRPEFEGPAMRRAMQVLGGSSNGAAVSISPMKTDAWVQFLTDFYGSTHKQWHTILPGINVGDYGGWTGEGGYILTVANNIRRPLFDLDAWLEATRDLPVKLVGEGNEGIRGSIGPAQSWEDLKSLYRCAAVYLNPTVPPNESCYNLASLEAAATGTPVVQLTKHPEHNGWEHSLENLRPLLSGATPRVGSLRQGELVAMRYPMDAFRQSWLDVLERVTA